jgi:hypothetical protein
MRSTRSRVLAWSLVAPLLVLLARAAPTAPAQSSQGTPSATPPQETIQLEQPTKLYEGPSPVFKIVGELKARAMVLLLAKHRAFARMREANGTLEGYGLLPAARRVDAAPQPERLTVSITPSPTVVALVTKGLAERLRASRGGDAAAVDRMEQLRFTPEQFAEFVAELGR